MDEKTCVHQVKCKALNRNLESWQRLAQERERSRWGLILEHLSIESPVSTSPERLYKTIMVMTKNSKHRHHILGPKQ